MSIFSALRVALAALLAHKGRTLLTSLGIVIGISAVIALVAAGDGARAKLDERLESIGKTMILIRSGVRTDQGAIADFNPMTTADADAIRHKLGPLVTGVAEVQLTHRLATTRNGSWPSVIVGSTPEVQWIRNWEVERGRFYNDDDQKKRAAVCLLGKTVSDKLFAAGEDPVGQVVRIDKTSFRVVGIAKSKGRSATGADQDDQIFVPLSTLQTKVVGEAKVNLILAAAKNVETLDEVKQSVTKLMRERHRLKPNDPADFDVSSVQELADLAVVVTATMQALSAIIASVSLLVGGIGIMNIMLVSVTERTREIGLRMAIGARGSDVLMQFLLESIVLSLLGGLVGVLIGAGLAAGAAQAVGWPLVIQPGVVGAAFVVSACVGLFFGFFPAWRASRLEPITALRHE